MKVPLKKTEKWLAENFKTLGFEIYDYLHLASALTMVVLLLVYWAQLNQVHAEVTLFKEVAFFCMSALLILFVAFIAENEDPHSERLVYNFCWLIASLILFIPALFDLIIFFVEGRDIYSRSSLFITDLASMLFPILSLAFFMIAILRLKKIKHWLNLMFFGIVLFLLGTVADMIQLIIELIFEGFSPLVLVELITALAPIAPAAFGFHDFHLLINYLKKLNEPKLKVEEPKAE